MSTGAREVFPLEQLTPEQARALAGLVRDAVNLDSLKEDRLPTAAAGARLLSGDMTQLIPATAMFLGRAAEIAAGMWAAGTWGKGSIKAALGGSAAVQLFLFTYIFFNRDKDLPSGDSAQALVEGKPEAIPTVVAHWAARSAMIACGMYAAGARKSLGKKALAGGAAIELSVLLWALSQRELKKSAQTQTLGAWK